MPKVKTIVKTTFLDRGWNSTMHAQLSEPKLHVEAGLLDDTSMIAEYGYYNEFGTSRIPERSFIRSTFDEQRAKYLRMLEKALANAQKGVSLRGSMLEIGIVMTNDVKLKITMLRTPPNAPATIKAKGSSNPLIGVTGLMRNAIRWRVEK